MKTKSMVVPVIGFIIIMIMITFTSKTTGISEADLYRYAILFNVLCVNYWMYRDNE